MRRIIACCLFVAGIAACERVCGELEPLPKVPETADAGGGAGEPVAGAGAGGVSAMLGGGGSGGVMSVAGSVAVAGSESGGTAGAACLPPPSALISDFELTPASPALGTMESDSASPDGTFETYMGSEIYRERGGLLPDQLDRGFDFLFNGCVDASPYTGISFDLRVGSMFGGIDVSMTTRSGSGESVHLDLNDIWETRCVPFVGIGDPKTILKLHFRYAPSSDLANVDLYVDNLAFYSGSCPTN